MTRAYKAAIKAVTIEEDGPLALTIKAEGSYQHQNQNKMKFCIRMYINKDSSDIRFVHTFFFDGDEQTDFLKGLGIRFDTVLKGALMSIISALQVNCHLKRLQFY